MPIPPSWRHWLLPASVTLNVFLCAALIAHFRAGWHHPGPPPPFVMLDQMARALSPEDAAILRTTLTPGIEAIEKAHRAEPGLPRHLQMLLAQEPFDKAAFKAALDQSQQARAILDEALPEALERLSPDGRRRLSVWQPDPAPGGPPR